MLDYRDIDYGNGGGSREDRLWVGRGQNDDILVFTLV